MIYNFIKVTLFCTFYIYGQNQDMPVDGIAAIVGENIILKSDVSQVVGMTALQKGLDIIKGKIIRLEKKNERMKIPHVGWNEVKKIKNNEIFKNINDNKVTNKRNDSIDINREKSPLTSRRSNILMIRINVNRFPRNRDVKPR